MAAAGSGMGRGSMSAEDSAPAFRMSDLIRHGAEPPPVALFTRWRSYPWLIVGVTCIGAFMGQVDASIVQLALPTFGQVVDATLESVSWVALGYLLGFASFLPIFGQLCQIFGRKLLYIIGFAVFTLASALCGLAPNLVMLVAFRLLQGVGGAMLGANSLSLVIAATDKSLRARALGVFAGAQAVGVSAGPVVGGLLLGTLGWPWVFWINVPFGLIAVVAGWLMLPKTAQQNPNRTFDWRGALMLTPALTLAVFALNQVSALGLTSPVLLGSVGAAIVLIFLFLRQERASRSPLIDLALLEEPAFLAGALACALSYAMLYGMSFLASFALVSGYEDSPTAAGLKLAIVPISIGIVAPVSGALADWMGTRLLKIVGMAICFVALLALTLVVREAVANLWIGFLGLVAFGIGLGVFIAPNNHATINAAPANLSGVAGAMLNLMRVLGTVVGVAIASAMLSWQLQVARGSAERRLAAFSPHHFVEAVGPGLIMLAVFALIAGATSLIRKHAS